MLWYHDNGEEEGGEEEAEKSGADYDFIMLVWWVEGIWRRGGSRVEDVLENAKWCWYTDMLMTTLVIDQRQELRKKAGGDLLPTCLQGGVRSPPAQVLLKSFFHLSTMRSNIFICGYSVELLLKTVHLQVEEDIHLSM